MLIRKVTDDIHYVGVNDRETVKFENMWPLPFGVSYNSYVVKGADKIALIDTVDNACAWQFIKELKAVIGDRNIDYIVVNHMEPDHSGAVPSILSVFPDIKIIGNRQTLDMLKGFYGVDEEKVIIIKDLDEIDLGGKTLRFVMTPMVHWPETMMTYVVEDRLLFSGDAFGTFGALNGGLIDLALDIDIYLEEAYRYYSNIVGKYGKFVQKAFEKLQNIQLDYICPTHGPVWHNDIDKIVEIYKRLSAYESEPGVTIVYGTMYGNTQDIVEVIASRLSEKGIKNIRIHNASKSDLSFMISDAFRYEGLIVGSPTYSMTLFPPVEGFMNAIKTREIKNKVMAYIGSFTWASAAVKSLLEINDSIGISCAGSLDMKQSLCEDTRNKALELADKVYENLKLK